MIEVQVTQNTQEWHRHRAGIPTGSAASRLITPTGKPSSGEAVEKYMYQLIYERIAENPIVSFKSFWMERGAEEEIRAVQLYEFSRDVETEPCGFILNDSLTAGASPDRKLTGKKQGLEIKAPKPENHLMYLRREGSAWKEHFPQLQFELMVSGWDAMDLYSFHPDLPPALILTERKDDYIETLTNIVGEFSIKLDKEYAAFVEMGLARADWRQPVKEEKQPDTRFPKREPLPPLTDLVKSALLEMNAK